MKQSPGMATAFRMTGLLAVCILGLVSIIATAGGDGGRTTEVPGAQESSLNYPGIDEQYRKDADLGKDKSIYYRDADGDGYGDPNDYAAFETQPMGYYVTQGNDCDDTNDRIHPMAAEVCGDNVDNDCDGLIDSGCDLTCTDADGDGYFAESECPRAVDCNDSSAAVHPGVAERCWDGVDNNCNGQIDEENCLFNGTDRDGDGYYADTGDNALVDCDDDDPDINPGAREYCGDDLDNDCDGQVDENCPLLPDTGQTACYNITGKIIACPQPGHSLYGQDASYTISPPSFTKLDASGNPLPDKTDSWTMIRDNVTGLIWENKTNDSGINDKDKRFNWADATDVFVARLNTDQFGGYSDWRIPTKKELINLIDYGRYSPALPNVFSYVALDNYWSATNNVCRPYHAWHVGFRYGIDNSSKKSMYLHVLAVRGVSPSPQLIDNNDGTISDRATGLMWMKATADADEDGEATIGDIMTWEEALFWCENTSFAGYSDWRLPTIKELVSMVSFDVDEPAVDTGYFPDTASSRYWSSTSSRANNIQGQAWAVDFTCGDTVNGMKTNTYYVRAVRGSK